jgi:hypothetical protein
LRATSKFAHLEADGTISQGKAIWVLAGKNIVVENIEFSGAAISPDHNAAGIRAEGRGLIVRDCFFHDNQNGILTAADDSGEILIECSEFARNGFGDGFSQ